MSNHTSCYKQICYRGPTSFSPLERWTMPVSAGLCGFWFFLIRAKSLRHTAPACHANDRTCPHSSTTGRTTLRKPSFFRVRESYNSHCNEKQQHMVWCSEYITILPYLISLEPLKIFDSQMFRPVRVIHPPTSPPIWIFNFRNF